MKVEVLNFELSKLILALITQLLKWHNQMMATYVFVRSLQKSNYPMIEKKMATYHLQKYFALSITVNSSQFRLESTKDDEV